MMKRFVFLLLCSVALGARAQNAGEELLQLPSPVYLRDYVQVGKASAHWFVGAQASALAFWGSPVGCSDLFQRTRAGVHAYVGKWITPGLGVRVNFQGLDFVGSDRLVSSFQAWHADLMWRLNFSKSGSDSGMPRWDVVPFLGLGLARGADVMVDGGRVANYPFIASWGVQGRYRLNKRLHLTAELGGFSSLKSFDGHGHASGLGDHLLRASVGLCLDLGVVGWKRSADAGVYADRCARLIDYAAGLKLRNEELEGRVAAHANARREWRKILEVEGLLDKYGRLLDAPAASRGSYRGLESLRARLREQQEYGAVGEPYMDGDSLELAQPNIPIYFFFKLGRAELTDDSQLINLDELARVAVAHGLDLRIVGAADSATGSPAVNERLSHDRAAFIAAELQKRGVEVSHMKGVSAGGISEYARPEQNRYTRVAIFLK